MDSSHHPKLTVILTRLIQWHHDHQEQLAAAGVTSALRASPPGRLKASVSLSMDSGTRLSQLIVWDSGETEPDLADINSGMHTPQHRVISTPGGLDDLLSQQLTWLRYQPPST